MPLRTDRKSSNAEVGRAQTPVGSARGSNFVQCERAFILGPSDTKLHVSLASARKVDGATLRGESVGRPISKPIPDQPNQALAGALYGILAINPRQVPIAKGHDHVGCESVVSPPDAVADVRKRRHRLKDGHGDDGRREVRSRPELWIGVNIKSRRRIEQLTKVLAGHFPQHGDLTDVEMGRVDHAEESLSEQITDRDGSSPPSVRSRGRAPMDLRRLRP